jgi:hypothetical protein
MNKILKFQRAAGVMPWPSSVACLGAVLLAGLATPARADATFGICIMDSAFGTGGESSAQYATSAVTAGCVPGFSSSVGTGGNVNPTSIGPGLTTATLTATQGTTVASSSSSLNQGVLRVDSNTDGSPGSGRAISEALFNDILHFTITNGAPSAVGTLNVHLDGSISAADATRFGYNIQDTFGLGGTVCWESTGGATPPFLGTSCNSFLTSSFTNQTVTGFDFTGTFSVTNGLSSNFFAALLADCGGGGLCGFSNTNSFSLSLPSNVTFTSDSGVLFTDKGSAVPEPSSGALLVAGMFAIGLAARRRFSATAK